MAESKPKTSNDDTGKLHAAVDQAKARASDAVHALEANPLGIVVGGLAVGALLGSLIPRSARERDLLAPVGQRLSSAASAATQAARDTGKAEFANIGLSRDNAEDQVKTLLRNVVQSLLTTGSAAVTAAKDQQRTN